MLTALLFLSTVTFSVFPTEPDVPSLPPPTHFDEPMMDGVGVGVGVMTSTESWTPPNNYQRDQDPDEPAGVPDKCVAFTEGSPEKNLFFSPNYPLPYTNSTDCIKIIEAPPSHYLKLDFRDKFGIEPSDGCKFDSLEIRDGPNGYDTLVGTYCGRKFPPMFTSSGRALWLRFKSDETIEDYGFKAVYEFVPREEETEVPETLCRKYLNAIEGFVNKSDIEQEFIDRATQYSVPLECMWTISADPGWRIQLQFNKFALEVPNDCDSNFLDIFPETTDIPSRMYNFCGSMAEMVQSPANVMKVRFLARNLGIKSNFEAMYTVFKDKPKSATSCDEGEYDCEDATCIPIQLKCNGRDNCRFRSDEEPSRCEIKEGLLADIFETEHMVIIIIVFFLILTGMCFAFIFNCVKKLIRDHRIIQEHMRRSREIRSQEDLKFNGPVPVREDDPSEDTISGSGPEVEMKDSVAQTTESVFKPVEPGSGSIFGLRPDFSTFGRPVETSRGLSMDSTKSAPDVIITWNHRSTLL